MPSSAIITRLLDHRLPGPDDQRYRAPMTTSTTAAAIAAGLREHLRTQIPYLPDRKVHALLYLAQGLCLAANDEPLFVDPIIATGQGVRLADVPGGRHGGLTDAEAVIVGVTAARYGGLSTADLESLIRGQEPWGATDDGREIGLDLVRRWFRTQDATPEGTVTGIPRSHRSPAGSDDTEREVRQAKPDDPAEIASFAAEMRARM